ncbi:hypothetical protein DITRI_Ditri05aG0088500 [Diplodiscus trichospermus]
MYLTQINKKGLPSIGVCSGRVGDNLPSEQDVVNLYKTNGIGAMRIYDPNHFTLQALRGTNIQLILGVPNGVLHSLANPSAANLYVKTYIVPYSPAVKFRYIAVGNEVKPTDPEAQFVLPAMQNIYYALASANLQDQIKVSTSVEPTLLGNSYPPSAGVFSEVANPYITPIIKFLTSKTGWPSAGEMAATVGNASTYYKNLINMLRMGHQRRLENL